LLGALAWLVASVEWFRGIGRVPLLEATKVPEPDRYPSVSVVVAARDEVRAVGEAVGSLLAQDYPGPFQVVAVDDRSTDGTGEVLGRLASEDAKLKVLRVQELPPGWLGKTHAQGLGAGEAAGEWLLFTDADVRFSPGAVRRAVAFAKEGGLDHLVLFPEVVSKGVLLRGFVGAFAGFFLMGFRPWRARDARFRSYVGVGAFQLVRRGAYEAVGGHRRIRLRPDDDVKLGKAIKGKGFRQDVAFGTGLVSVEWHRSALGAVRGLEKSIFPGVDYSLPVALFAAVGLVFTNVVPYGSLLFSRGPLRYVHGLNVALILAFYAVQARYTGDRLPLLYWALHPVSAGLLAYATLRSAYKILHRGGLEWRGTFYPLEELKQNRV